MSKQNRAMKFLPIHPAIPLKSLHGGRVVSMNPTCASYGQLATLHWISDEQCQVVTVLGGICPVLTLPAEQIVHDYHFETNFGVWGNRRFHFDAYIKKYQAYEWTFNAGKAVPIRNHAAMRADLETQLQDANDPWVDIPTRLPASMLIAGIETRPVNSLSRFYGTIGHVKAVHYPHNGTVGAYIEIHFAGDEKATPTYHQWKRHWQIRKHVAESTMVTLATTLPDSQIVPTSKSEDPWVDVPPEAEGRHLLGLEIRNNSALSKNYRQIGCVASNQTSHHGVMNVKFPLHSMPANWYQYEVDWIKKNCQVRQSAAKAMFPKPNKYGLAIREAGGYTYLSMHPTELDAVNTVTAALKPASDDGSASHPEYFLMELVNTNPTMWVIRKRYYATAKVEIIVKSETFND